MDAPAAPIRVSATRWRRGVRPGEEPVEIAADVFCLGPWGRSQTNVYVVRDGGSWALVDAGWEQDAPRIEAAVRSLLGSGVRPATIVLTHAHPDHCGAARPLAEAWRCPILLHPGESAIARGDVAAMERYAGPLDRFVVLPALRAMGERRRAEMISRSTLAGLFRELEAEGTVPGLDGWRWVGTPGHSPGHVSLVRSSDRVVLTGDALLTLLVNGPAGFLAGRQGLSMPPWYTTWDWRKAAASVGTVASLEPTVLGTGHGRPMTGAGTAAAVRRFADQVRPAEPADSHPPSRRAALCLPATRSARSTSVRPIDGRSSC